MKIEEIQEAMQNVNQIQRQLTKLKDQYLSLWLDLYKLKQKMEKEKEK